MKSRKLTIKILLAASLLLAIFFLGKPVLAQVDAGLGYLEQSGLGTADIRVTIANIIRIILGFLGTLAVVIVLIGGFKWMTAAGNEEKLAGAKKLLLNGAIGLVIVLFSFGIASFVISRLMQATGGGGGGVVGGEVPGGGVFYPNNLVVKSITPQGPVPIRNVKVRVIFNKEIKPESVTGKIEVRRANDDSEAAGNFDIGSRSVEFSPSAACPEPNQNLKCFDSNTEYRVEIKEGVKSADDKDLKCGGAYPKCNGFFTTGDLVDVTPPTGVITNPDDGGSFSVDDSVLLQAATKDDSGIGLVEFYVDGRLIDSDGPEGPTASTYLAEGYWETAGVELLSRHEIYAQVFDINDHKTNTDKIYALARAKHCFNGIKDEKEEGVDCGGEREAKDYCGACAGGDCDRADKDAGTCAAPDNTFCASGYCESTTCKCQIHLKISNIYSGDKNDFAGLNPNGSPGNYLTIKGEGFGRSLGQVIFLGSDLSSDDKIAALASCSSAWQDKQVVVEIPAGVVDGSIKLITGNKAEDSTDDAYGPIINDFQLNDSKRPGICEVSPREGVEGGDLNISGKGFGDQAGALYFGSEILKKINSWQDGKISSVIPNFNLGDYLVLIKAGEEFSNGVNFSLIEGKSVGPHVDYLNPEKGRKGQYVTIVGSRFGSGQGTVNFINRAKGNAILASTDFPAACQSSWWRDNYVIVRVPEIGDGTYDLVLTTAKNRDSNPVPFEVTGDPLTPGICNLNPDNGLVNTKVNISGGGFASLGSESRIDFWQNKKAEAVSWSDDKIFTTVPPDTQTGPVFVTSNEKKDGANLVSNRIPFRVGACEKDSCLEGETCCGDGICRGTCFDEISKAKYRWYFNTGELPKIPQVVEECAANSAPSPVPFSKFGNTDVCLNVIPSARFSVPMQYETLIKENILFEECATGAEGKMICIPVEDYSIAISSSKDSESGKDRFEIYPGGKGSGVNLKSNTSYRVVLTTALRGADTEGKTGANMIANVEECGQGNAYCWGFKTGDKLCDIGDINVLPSPNTLRSADAQSDYEVVVRAKDNSCWGINPFAYDWWWIIADPSKADVTNAELDGKGLPEQIVTAKNETLPDRPTQVMADTEDKLGDGELHINYAFPAVINHSPACQNGICSNAEISATFNVQLENYEDNILLYKCAEESCKYLSEIPVAYTSEKIAKTGGEEVNEKITLTILGENEFLEKDTWYRVQVKGGDNGVKSKGGERSLIGGNDGADYSWKFQTRDNDKICDVEQVEVFPRKTTLYYIGQRKELTSSVSGPEDACGNGQSLAVRTNNPDTGASLDNYNWQWESSVPNLVTLTGSALGRVAPWDGELIDANPIIGGACSSKCLRVGSKTGGAICGNGVWEKGEDCDGGGGCSAKCLSAGSVSPAVCGDGYIGAPDKKYEYKNYLTDLRAGRLPADFKSFGEECDDGKHCANGAYCSSDTECELVMRGFCGTPANFELCKDNNWATFDKDGKKLESILDKKCQPRSSDSCSGQCLNEGAAFELGTCGNGQIGGGEDCDDGNRQPGDGCSAACLNEGSAAGAAVCQNAIVESKWEDCDEGAGNNPAAGCSNSCLNEGSRVTPCAYFFDKIVCGRQGYCQWDEMSEDDPSDDLCVYNNVCESKTEIKCLGLEACRWVDNECHKAICGDGAVDISEDCDDGNLRAGDGCSAKCVKEGASLTYTNASVCGDGEIKTGEECDSGSGDGKKDPYQAVTAIDSTPTSAIIKASVNNAAGKKISCDGEGCAEVEVVCVCSDDDYCEGYSENLACNQVNRCCYPRPTIVAVKPAHDNDPEEPNACPNGVLEVEFDQQMDLASLAENIKLYHLQLNTPCNQEALSWHEKLGKWAKNMFAKIGLAAVPEYWCPVAGAVRTVTLDNGGNKINKAEFVPNDILDVNNTYRLFVKIDNETTAAITEGVRSLTGGVGVKEVDAAGGNTHFKIDESTGRMEESSGNFDRYFFAHFVTGMEICQVEQVVFKRPAEGGKVIDPYIFRRAADEEIFEVEAQTENGQPLRPFPEYHWSWSWQPGETGLVKVSSQDKYCSITKKDCSDKEVGTQCSVADGICVLSDIQTITPENNSGDTTLTVTAEILNDELNKPATKGEKVEGVIDIKNRICENLWSSAQNDEYKWLEASTYLFESDLLKISPISGNFSTWYCRDAGNPDKTEDDLPDLNIITVAEEGTGIREYLFKDPSTPAAVGFRILPNLKHLSLLNWYKEQEGLSGNPQTMGTIDGYSALRDGNTVYINFANNSTKCFNADSCFIDAIYTNVLAVSFTETGGQNIQNIFNQLVKYLKFNESFYPHGPGSSSRSFYSNNAIANAAKAQLLRDTRRWEDLTDIAATLNNYAENHSGQYPKIEAGSFLPGLTISAWPSWNTVLGNNLGMALPEDPKNEFSADCSEGTFLDEPFNAATCWSSKGAFYCPQNSHIYWYNHRADGQYNLAGEFEFNANEETAEYLWRLDSAKQNYQLLRNIYITVSSDAAGGPSCNSTPASPIKGVCGDGYIDLNEVCDGAGYFEIKDNNNYPCRAYYTCKSDCSAKIYKDSSGKEVEIKTSSEETNLAASICQYVGRCGDGIVSGPETCDDGVERNGQYGRCPKSCRQSDAVKCGDYNIDKPFEVCDKGGKTEYGGTKRENSCRWDCLAYGPYCGDKVVEEEYGEVCELGEIVTPQENCPIVDGYQQFKKYQCSSDCQKWNLVADCSSLGQQCGNKIKEGTEECDDGKNTGDKDQNGIPDGNEDACNNDCKLTVCGDSKIQNPNGLGQKEECDLGAGVNGVSCREKLPYSEGINEAPQQCTYCDANCRSVRVQGPYCGDGIIDVGHEECDGNNNLEYCEDGIRVRKLTCNNSCDWDKGKECEYVGEGESCTVGGGDEQVCDAGMGCVNGKCQKCFDNNGRVKPECQAVSGFIKPFDYCTNNSQCLQAYDLSWKCSSALKLCLPETIITAGLYGKSCPGGLTQHGGLCYYRASNNQVTDGKCPTLNMDLLLNRGIKQLEFEKFKGLANNPITGNFVLCVFDAENYKKNICSSSACGGDCGHADNSWSDFCPSARPNSDQPNEQCSGGSCNQQSGSILGKFSCRYTDTCGNSCLLTGFGCCNGSVYDLGVEKCENNQILCQETGSGQTDNVPPEDKMDSCYNKCCDNDEYCSSATQSCVECEKDNHCSDNDKDKFCVNYECVECRENANCIGGKICLNNQCADAPQCQVDSDCKVMGANAKCVNKKCGCSSSCSGKQCGDDGCGGDCGECRESWSCSGNTSVHKTSSCKNNQCTEERIDCSNKGGCDSATGKCKGCTSVEHTSKNAVKYTKCFDGDAWWVDGCGQKDGLYENCSDVEICEKNEAEPAGCECKYGDCTSNVCVPRPGLELCVEGTCTYLRECVYGCFTEPRQCDNVCYGGECVECNPKGTSCHNTTSTDGACNGRICEILGCQKHWVCNTAGKKVYECGSCP
ncbi:MAG: Ig-like domain-containing protein [Patescibacteria group bacterium]|nr:Ig-like domain-containing protein [Patescibacteria group bacterium]MDD5490242.1 Ig-like domain-containing protein [Patescibacteria group bacterium]